MIPELNRWYDNSTTTNPNMSKENYMNQGFKTTALQIIVENTTHAGSGFGITDAGDAVFMSRRLMEVMDLQYGDLVTAHCIPNFEDKRDMIPWRAIRVDRSSITPDITIERARTAAEIDEDIYQEIMENQEPWTTAELAEHVDLDTKTVGNSCTRLFHKGKISKADVYGSSGQERPSFILWGSSLEAFK